MLGKSIIAGTVLSLMAGGVVYFGTDIDTSAIKEKMAQKTAEVKASPSDKVMTGEKVETPKTKISVDTPSVKTASGKVIEAKKPTISYSSNAESKKAETAKTAAQDNDVEKKWLNQYLKKETPKAKKTPKTRKIKALEVVSPEPTAKEQMEDKVQIAPKESYGSGSGASRKKTAKFIVKDKAEDAPSETGRKRETRKMLHELLKKNGATTTIEGLGGDEKKVDIKVIANEDGETTIETETIDMGDGKIMKIVKKTVKSEDSHGKNGKKMRIKVMTDSEGHIDAEDIKIIKMGKTSSIDELLMEEKFKDISSTVKIVMAQAEKIKMPELRDRAYLDLVSYGLENGNYSVASKALKKINQVELRDTARNRIAVAYAKDGNAENAFGILDELEVDALRDVMRLQVIEAMIAPDELPKDMQ